MSHSTIRTLFLTAAGVASLTFLSPALAQTASQITPESYAPPVRQDGSSVILPDNTGPRAPSGAEAISVTLSGLQVEGANLSEAALQDLTRTLIGAPIPVAQIYEAAARLEQTLARSGAVLTRVVVPAQDINDGGTLRLVVVEGYISDIDTSRLPENIRAHVTRLLAPLIGDRQARLGDIERRLLLAGDTPGTALRSTLTSGSEPGAVLLIIEADYQPFRHNLSIDNSASEAIGKQAYSLGTQINSVFGLGESIYANISGDPGLDRTTGFTRATPRNRALAAGVVFPIGNNGLTANIEVTDARTTPRTYSALQPGVTSHFQRASLRLSYPAIRSRDLNLTFTGSYDVQEEEVRIYDPLDLALSLDKLRVLRAGADLMKTTRSGTHARVTARASFGLDAFGARSASDASPALPLSRMGSDAEFQKLSVNFDVSHPLADHLTVAAMGAAQTSFGDPLSNSEQFGIAYGQAISPLNSGSLQGDAGYVLRPEIRVPFGWLIEPGFVSLTPYGFAAMGELRVEAPTALERRITKSNAYGAGLRAGFSARNGAPAISTSVEYGRAETDGRADEDRITASLHFHF